ncbi:hypothetical protein Acsp03_35310 [Actinomadura sp. NBRC 104412]|uniref:hypothetical protein n=1 Tax=Actinomadura sp. NBRC 104412 TaxID=3032203 RepID=UPI0024A5B9C7|nr:hypothetical protein [Actinomadura sp. NBRC 104412]GLZ06065.1 hypothetical protein Acsp03_35310 [Actinomadura sp. NBRC 104412]
MPDFPDPTIVRGAAGARDADFRGIPKGDVERAFQVCDDIARQHPPAPPPTEPPSAATLQHMRQYAACMRQRGAGPFPDPKADGTFPILGTPFEGLAPYNGQPLSDAVNNAERQCRQYQVEWRMHGS